MRSCALIALMAASVIAGFLSPAWGQEGVTYRRHLQATRINRPPVIDGDLSDQAWQDAAKADRFTDVQNERIVPDQTTAYIGYDDLNIYVAFRCLDSQPSGIIGRETKRDVRFQGEDQVAFSIDPFNTHRFDDRSFFIINPLGTQFAHLGSGRASKLEWEGAWKAAARRTPDGWTVELAIPWAILNYPGGRGAASCSINFDRTQYRTNTHSIWSNYGTQEFYQKDGLWDGVQYPKFRTRVSLLPYIAPTLQDGGGSAFHTGMDIRAAVSPTYTMVGTIKPDFENVEQAVEGIDFSYGERFVPDARPFFLEGANIYQSGGQAGRYFYSRRIPDFDAGTNFYGKLTARDTLGVLSAVRLGSFADWVVRARHQFSGTFSVDSAFINQDQSFDHNRVAVFGENYQRGLWQMDAAYAGSWTGESYKGGTGNASLSYSGTHFFAGVSPFTVQPGFTDNLGFIPFTNFHGVDSFGGYFADYHKGALRNISVFVDSQRADHFDGTTFNHQTRIQTGVVTHHDDSFNLNWMGGPFEQFDDSVYTMSWQARSSDLFHNYGVGYSWGRQAGEPYTFVTPTATWRFFRRLTLGVASSILHHGSDPPYQHIVTFNYDFSPRQGLAGRAVVQSTGTNAYIAFRRSGYGGVETWLIFGDPNAPKFRARLSAKVVWPL